MGTAQHIRALHVLVLCRRGSNVPPYVEAGMGQSGTESLTRGQS